MNNWMIYGANGYTGELIAREAKVRGLNPILAGRNQKALLALAKTWDLIAVFLSSVIRKI